MKKLSALLLSVCAAVCVIAFAACNNDENNQATGDTTVVTTETSIIFTVDADFYALSETTSIYNYLCALQDAGKLTFVSSSGDYGEFITAVNGTEQYTNYTDTGSSGKSWALYTSVTTVDGVSYSSDYSTYTYENATLYYSSYGISYLPAIDGETYALIFEEWSYTY